MVNVVSSEQITVGFCLFIVPADITGLFSGRIRASDFIKILLCSSNTDQSLGNHLTPGNVKVSPYNTRSLLGVML